MSTGLNRRLAKAVPWAILESLLSALHGVVMIIIIGRFVTPTELGTAGLALATAAIVELATTGGIQDAVIRARSTHTRATDTAFTLSVMWASAGLALNVAAALLATHIYGVPELLPMTLVASCIALVNTLAAVPTGLLVRKMRAAMLTRRMLLGKLVSAAITCGLGIMGYGAWAVILASVVSAVVMAIAVAFTVSRLPRLRFAAAEVPEFFRFGIGISIENLVWGVLGRVFSMLFGYFHGLQALGFFNFSLRLVDETANLIQTASTRFALAFFSGLERSAADSLRPFIKGTKFLTVIATPVFITLALLAGDLVPFLFGPRWLPAVPYIQILAVAWMVAFPRILIGPMLRARGRQSLLIANALVSFALVMGLALVTGGLAPIWAVVGWASRQFYASIWGAVVSRKYLNFNINQQILTIYPAVAGGVALSVGIFSLGFLYDSSTHLMVKLISQGALGIGIYAATLVVLDREVVEMARSFYHRLRH